MEEVQHLNVVAGLWLIWDTGGVYDPALRDYCPILEIGIYQPIGLSIIIHDHLKKHGHASIIGGDIGEDKGRSQPSRTGSNLKSSSFQKYWWRLKKKKMVDD